MEKMNYIVEESILAELLGVQNFSNKESAILELVKNAFDARALAVKIIIRKNAIEIIDNGDGMNEYDLKTSWMHIGKSDKGYEVIDENGEIRILAGSKGVGRFALARLGAEAVVESRKKDCDAVQWYTNWNYSTLQKLEKNISKGTHITIKQLRDNWSASAVSTLADYLSRTYRDTTMKIELYYEDEKFEIKSIFKNLEIGKNYSTKIFLKYVSETNNLFCKFSSDEFEQEAQKYSREDINNFETAINVYKEFSYEVFEDDLVDLNFILENLGDFSAELYFAIDRVTNRDKEKFLYKRLVLEDRNNYGIILYRNAFSISSYEGKKDWLELGKRSRKSPAAATHPSGSWRVRENQIFGNVNIDKIENKYLQDLANRQGLEENVFYKAFIEILHMGLREFERYRQAIIRDINKKNIIKDYPEKLVTEKIVKSPSIIKDLNKEDIDKLVKEISDYKKEGQKYKKDIEETENRYKYDVRILNVLATSGLKATSVAHEMKNDRNKIEGNYDFVVNSLKKYGVWEMLNSPENTKVEHRNVPALLWKNKEASNKILRFMNIMLNDIEKQQFIPKENKIEDSLVKIKHLWEKDYAWIKIEIKSSGLETFMLPEDVLTVIFDNLILNSIQQNEKERDNIIINIEVFVDSQFIHVKYCDNGIGLPEKYKRNPMKILEAHETSRPNGHGLGMWILNNTLAMSGGEVINIVDNNGFGIKFIIGGNL